LTSSCLVFSSDANRSAYAFRASSMRRRYVASGLAGRASEPLVECVLESALIIVGWHQQNFVLYGMAHQWYGTLLEHLGGSWESETDRNIWRHFL
jgi:hypothetical protein